MYAFRPSEAGREGALHKELEGTQGFGFDRVWGSHTALQGHLELVQAVE